MSIPCPACRATDFQALAWSGRAGNLDPHTHPLEVGSSRATARPVALERCATCGILRQMSPPSPDELTAAYTGLEDPTYADQEAGRSRAFERSLRRLQPALPRPGRLLDIGCSTGLFLEVAAHAGWQVAGVEPSRWAAAEAMKRVGAVVHQGTIENTDVSPAGFDLVTLWDVLEHTVDPALVIERIATLTAARGYLVINVPAADTLIARVMRGAWPLILPEHLFYFTARSLALLLARGGFEVVGSYQHVVYFSLPYILRRLSQHRVVPSALAETMAALRALHHRHVPLLMGERMLLARRQN